MPIRLNLLAEAQAAEEMRRRDPVKRAIWVGALIIVVMLVWSSSIQLEAMLASSEVSRLEGQISSHTNAYKVVLDEQNKTAEIKEKLSALHVLATNRLLNGTLLNALQQTTVADVQLHRPAEVVTVLAPRRIAGVGVRTKWNEQLQQDPCAEHRQRRS